MREYIFIAIETHVSFASYYDKTDVDQESIDVKVYVKRLTLRPWM